MDEHDRQARSLYIFNVRGLLRDDTTLNELMNILQEGLNETRLPTSLRTLGKNRIAIYGNESQQHELGKLLGTLSGQAQ